MYADDAHAVCFRLLMTIRPNQDRIIATLDNCLISNSSLNDPIA